MERTRIVDLLKKEASDAPVLVKGWVRTRRGNRQVQFIALNDGSTIHNLQVVADAQRFDGESLKLVTTGACIRVTGKLVPSQGQGQSVEIQADEIEVYGG
ncbi:MAG: asparagine--tRNA ligase, partial [Tannerella sp.]|nr:asparagine--tRNA ligase [Tannerella sp.]